MTREQFKLGETLLISAIGDFGYLWECTVAQIEDIGVKLTTPGNPNGEWYRWESMDLANWTLQKVLSNRPEPASARKWSGEWVSATISNTTVMVSGEGPPGSVPLGVKKYRVKWEAEEILD